VLLPGAPDFVPMFRKQQTNQLARLQFRIRASLLRHLRGTFRAVPGYDLRRGRWFLFRAPEVPFPNLLVFRHLDQAMNTVIGILITFLVVILVLYLVNMLPIDGRAKQIVRVIVIILGIVSLLKYLAVY
jgi:hypothetical protein